MLALDAVMILFIKWDNSNIYIVKTNTFFLKLGIYQ